MIRAEDRLDVVGLQACSRFMAPDGLLDAMGDLRGCLGMVNVCTPAKKRTTLSTAHVHRAQH
jgi:hypothetical protein